MKIKFLWIGKSKDEHIKKLIDIYSNRLGHYCPVKIQVLKEPKSRSKNKEELKKAEGELLLSKLEKGDYVVLLDERGKHLTSIQLSEWVQHKRNISINQIVFIIGGAYGAHSMVETRSDFTLSLSHLTLTHDMARIFIIEQVYRAHTILKGEKYHNS